MVIFYNLNLNFSKYNYFLKLKNQFSNFFNTFAKTK